MPSILIRLEAKFKSLNTAIDWMKRFRLTRRHLPANPKDWQTLMLPLQQ